MRALAAADGTRGVVADGRDAGSVIFPEAGFKVFVAASLDVRARRRAAQRGDADFAAVRAALVERDRRDAARGASAPRPDPAGRVLENELLTVEEALGRLLAWVRERFPNPAACGPATTPERP
jgi:cytidylate kinase